MTTDLATAFVKNIRRTQTGIKAKDIFKPPFYKAASSKASMVHKMCAEKPYMILYGATQSTKSYTAMAEVLRQIVLRYPPSRYFIGAQTREVLFRNDWHIFKKMVNPKLIRQASGEDYMLLKDVPHETHILTRWGKYSTIMWIPFDDFEKAKGVKIRGYKIDESNVIEEDVIAVLDTRFGIYPPKESFKILTTNPDASDHYQYLNFVNPSTRKENWNAVHFIPEDNPFLSEERKDELRKNYPPGTVWHRRYILGEWCSAEGAAWPQFKEAWVRSMYGRMFQNVHYIGVDYGLRDPMAIVLHSLTDDNVLVAREEYVKTDMVAADVVNVIDDMCKRANVNVKDCQIVVDRSAAGFIEEFKRASGKLPDGSYRMNPKPSISDNKMDRVRLAYSLALAGSIVYEPRCKRLISNCKTVKWKTVGTREQITGDDHAFDAHLYAVGLANKKHKLFTRTEVKPAYFNRSDDDDENPHAAVERELERIRP